MTGPAVAIEAPPSSALELNLRALRPLLADPEVTELCINRPGEAFLETRHGWERRALPFAAFTFVVAAAASMGIPGFSGFAAEITILIGAWKTYPIAVWIAGAGMVLAAAFTLRALKLSFFGDQRSSVPTQEGRVALNPDWNEEQRITIPEKIGASILMITTFAVGIYPKPLLDRIIPAVETMRFLK